MKNNNILKLYSNDKKINAILLDLKKQTKIYLRIITALQILGNFNEKANVELYNIIDNEEEQKTFLFCSDLNDDIFIFCGKSSNRKDWLLITKLTNTSEKKYDISLAKKSELNNENIDLTRFDEKYDFKYGRLITNNKDFYSLFFGNNICYQIHGDFNNNISKELLNNLNQFPTCPNLQNIVSIFEKVIEQNEIDFSQLKISVYENFERSIHIDLNDKYNNVEKHKKVRIKNRL